jgi:hypothetical protein
MGKTVQIDDDVMRAAERLAAERGTTPDAVISEAARKALVEPAETSSGAELRHRFLYEDGWYVLPSRGGVVTNELIDQIQEELDQDDARLAGRERSPGADG